MAVHSQWGNHTFHEKEGVWAIRGRPHKSNGKKVSNIGKTCVAKPPIPLRTTVRGIRMRGRRGNEREASQQISEKK